MSEGEETPSKPPTLDPTLTTLYVGVLHLIDKRKVSDGVGVDGVAAKFPFAVSLRDNRRQLPRNV